MLASLGSREVEGTHGYNSVDDNTQSTFQVVGFLVSQEISDNQNSKNEHDDIENIEV